MRENTKGIRWKISPVVRSDTLLFLLEERFDLLESFLVLRDVKVFLDDSNEHVDQDEVGQDEPADEEYGTDPRGPLLGREAGNRVQDFGPVLAGENLVHAEERVEYRSEVDSDIPASGVLGRDLAPEELTCEDGHEEGDQEDEQHKVADTCRVAEHQLDQLAGHGHGHDDPVYPQDLEDGQPGVDLTGVADRRYQDDGRGDGKPEVDHVLEGVVEAPPVGGEAYHDLDVQENSHDDLGRVQETVSRRPGRCAPEALGKKVEGDDENPEPGRLVVNALQRRHPPQPVVDAVRDESVLVGREGASLLLLADDLERRSDDGNQQVGHPEHHDHDAGAEEQGRRQHVRVHRVVHQIAESVGRHDDEDQLERVQDVVEVERAVVRVVLLETYGASGAYKALGVLNAGFEVRKRKILRYVHVDPRIRGRGGERIVEVTTAEAKLVRKRCRDVFRL